AAERLPTLLVNSRSRAGVPAIRLADDRAAGMAVDHLVGLGHREVGYVGGRPGSDLTVRRRAGWAETLGRHGLPVRDEWVVERDWDAEAGYAAATQLLSREDRPTSLFVANVVICVGALAAARDLGIRVPDELSVVAVHDVWFAAHDAPPLTTVRLPLQDMGRRAVELLLDGQVSGVGEPASEYVLDEPAPLLVTRASTPPPPCSPLTALDDRTTSDGPSPDATAAGNDVEPPPRAGAVASGEPRVRTSPSRGRGGVVCSVAARVRGRPRRRAGPTIRRDRHRPPVRRAGRDQPGRRGAR